MNATASGGMTQEIFPNLCQHFVENLPEGMGKGGKPVFLFLDGHASRWNIEAAGLLEEHNVITVVIPSHSSSWSQANDCGPNKLFKRIYGEVCNQIRTERNFQLENFTEAIINDAIKRALERFVTECHEELQEKGHNTVTQAFMDIGIFPFNSNCDNWNNVLDR